MNRIDIIRCPNCGAEYTAGEIYLPEYFLGKPKYLEKDYITHKILYDNGKPMNTKEYFTCEYCNTPFIVSAYVKFNVEEDAKHNFNKNYTTHIEKNLLFLNED